MYSKDGRFISPVRMSPFLPWDEIDQETHIYTFSAGTGDMEERTMIMIEHRPLRQRPLDVNHYDHMWPGIAMVVNWDIVRRN